MTTTTRPSHAPPLSALMHEMRAVGEFAAYLALAPVMAASHIGHHRGDGHTVMVLPPFLADDSGTAPLRAFLGAIGYRAEGWGLGPNLGVTSNILDGVPAKLDELYEESGQPVSLVGWSAGGLWAREAARRRPEAVRQVIMMGSPFRLRPGDRTNATVFLEMVSELQVPMPEDMRREEHERDPLPVPCTSIYSRTDGVTNWAVCLEEEGPQTENVEVFGSHIGMGHNPAVLLVVGDRLAPQPQGWKRFVPPHHVRHFFPKPVSWVRPS